MMTTQAEHPDIEELVDWARGLLSRRRHEEVRRHCDACPTCNMRLAKILVLRTDDRRRMRRRARRVRQLQMAAVIVLLVGTGAVFLLSGYFSNPTAELAALATTETIPESHVHMRFRRGLRASADLYDYKLEAGMEALVQRDYRMASETLEELYGEHPESSEAAAYLGVALYLSGDDSGRTKSILAMGTQHMQPMISRTATWFLANSRLRSGDVESAVELLRTLDPNRINDMYGRWSVDLLDRIQGIRDRQPGQAH
jgi:hypothetical protein